MSPHAEWHTDAFPEFRASPPWVMEEMMAAEPSLAGPIAEQVESARALATVVKAAADDGDPVAVVGCGTSEHGAMAVAEQLDEALVATGSRGGRVESRQAFEAALDPRSGGLCLGISHEGETKATAAALAAARSMGATTGLVTAAGDVGAAKLADHVFVTPVLDRSWCHTVGYVSPILAGGAVAAGIRGAALNAAAAETLLAAGHETMAQAAAVVAAALHGVRHLITSGSGADRVAAREFALKVEEGVQLSGTARDLETVLHGHLVACDETTGLVVFLTDSRRGGERAARGHGLLRAAGRLGVRTAVVVTPDVDATLPADATSAGRIVVPEAQDLPVSLSCLLVGAAALQQLTIALIHRAGTNPDLIRREESAYREASAIAEDRFPAG